MRLFLQYHARRPLIALSYWPFLYPRRYASQKLSDPLRILFCGSDKFSIASLCELYEEHRKNKDFIASIDVVCRPGKRVGRNLKTIREVPISAVSKDLSLPLHQIDTFTGWNPPTPQGQKINLIVAVSFGLLIPPRILGGVKYGGLNLHPSMLPDFRGPAPLHHVLLSGEKNIGITLQTLHPTKFDEGRILAQTEYPGFEHSCNTVPELLKLVAPKGAEMLLKGLRDHVYVPPIEDVGSPLVKESVRPLRCAPKIYPHDRHIDWDTWTADRIIRTHRVIGPLWNNAKTVIAGQVQKKRIIWATGFEKVLDPINIFPEIGRPMLTGLLSKTQSLIVRTCDGHALVTDQIKIAGESTAPVWPTVLRVGMVAPPEDVTNAAEILVPTGDIGRTGEQDFAVPFARLK